MHQSERCTVHAKCIDPRFCLTCSHVVGGRKLTIMKYSRFFVLLFYCVDFCRTKTPAHCSPHMQSRTLINNILV